MALDDVAANYTFGSPKFYLTDYQTGLIESDISEILKRTPL